MKVKIGTTSVNPDTYATRDAIHVPVIVCQCSSGVTLHPGQKVRFRTGHCVTPDEEGIGIVDPFLTEPIKGCSVFFNVFINPGSVTQLTHSWECDHTPSVEQASYEDEDYGCRGCY